MIKIRSNEATSTSNSAGLCFMQRIISEFSFKLKQNRIITVVQDVLFKEQPSTRLQPILDANGEVVLDAEGNITEETVNVIERKIIEVREERPYSFSYDNIDDVFGLMGKSITPKKKFTSGILLNLSNIILAQTAQANRQGTSNWSVDTDHIIVEEFTV